MITDAYRVVNEDANALANEGWDILPPSIAGTDIVPFKEVILPRESELVTAMIRMYESSEWRNMTRKRPEVRRMFDGMGLRLERVYDDASGKKVRKVVLDDKAWEYLTSWRVEVNMTDGDRILGLTSWDPYMPLFVAKEVLDKECKEVVDGLMSKGIIEVTVVQEGGDA